MRPSSCPLILVAMLAAFTVSRAAINIEEKIVGPPYETGTIYTLSPHGLSLATVHAKGSRFAVTVDGVEGPAYDEILRAAVKYTSDGFEGFSPFGGETAPVAFSPDGRRYAYVARVAKDVIVIADGKEIFRAAHVPNQPPVGLLSFSPDGKRVLFLARATDAAKEVLRDIASGDPLTQTTAVRLMIDGKAAAPPYVPTQMAFPIFNTDGSRWALLGGRAGKSGVGFLIVDGKDAGDTGGAEQQAAVELLSEDGRQTRRVNYGHPRFTPDGRRLVSLRIDQPNKTSQVLVDGKPILTGATINGFVINSRGDIAAVATDRDGKRQLYINGKPVAGTDKAYHVVFSPDGKRWAAPCAELTQGVSAGPGSGIHANGAWVVVDGKKQQEYKKVSDVAFTPDSSRCVYIAEAAGPTGKKFVVINGEEDAGTTQLRIKPLFSKSGNRVAYSGEVMGGKVQVYLDGKALPPSSNAHNLTLSPDGSRQAYYAAESSLGSALVVDGEPKARGGGFGGPILFSVDSQHFVTIASPPKGGGASLFVDGEFLPFAKGLQNAQALGFTADSRNLILGGQENGPEGRPARTYYINGERVAQFSNQAVSSFGTMGQPAPWEAQSDGSVLLIGAEPTGLHGGAMKRIKATPAAGTSVATWIAEVKGAKDKEIADAKAKKEKAVADAVEKKKKAEADRLAALDARAKAKAEADAKRARERADALAKRAQDKAAADAARKAKATAR